MLLTFLTITLPKLSVLYLFHRIFGVHRTFRKAVMVIGILCILWLVSVTLGVAFRCSPVQKAWDPTISGRCLPLPGFVVGSEIPNSLLDFVIVGLPIPLILKLQLQMRVKIGLALVFIMGGL